MFFLGSRNWVIIAFRCESFCSLVAQLLTLRMAVMEHAYYACTSEPLGYGFELTQVQLSGIKSPTSLQPPHVTVSPLSQ